LSSVFVAHPRGEGGRFASIRSAVRRTVRLFQYDVWNIGVVQQTAEDIVRRGIAVAPSWLPPLPPGQYLADPAYRANADGSCRIFAEFLNHYGTGIGEIWCADVKAGESLASARLRPLLRFPHHASYPFPIADGTGRDFLTAETCQANGVLLWEDRDTPTLLGPIISGYAVVDPTLWRQESDWFLFCCLADHNPEEGLFLFHAPDLAGPWTPHLDNPVRRGLVGSRPAGPLFKAGGKLIRPGQDCSREYGGAVILYEVTRLDRTGYAEAPVRRLDPCGAEYGAGLHTICPAGDATLIDGKSWRFGVRANLHSIRRRMTAGRLSGAAVGQANDLS
jgi:hypothetical protein